MCEERSGQSWQIMTQLFPRKILGMVFAIGVKI